MANGFYSEKSTRVLKSIDKFKRRVMKIYSNTELSFVNSPQKAKNSRGEYVFTVIEISGGRECFVARQGMVLGKPWAFDNYTNQFDSFTEYFGCSGEIDLKSEQDHFDGLEYSLKKFKP